MEILIIEKPPVWQPTHRQWLCWTAGHCCAAGWVAAALAIDAYRPENLRPDQWPIGTMLQTINLIGWIAFAVGLNYLPVLSDFRLSVAWRLLGCVTISITFIFAVLMSVVIAGIYALTQSGFQGIH